MGGVCRVPQPGLSPLHPLEAIEEGEGGAGVVDGGLLQTELGDPQWRPGVEVAKVSLSQHLVHIAADISRLLSKLKEKSFKNYVYLREIVCVF